jgi:hypothetical protein
MEIIDREDLQVDGRTGPGNRGGTGMGREQDSENKDEKNKEAESRNDLQPGRYSLPGTGVRGIFRGRYDGSP